MDEYIRRQDAINVTQNYHCSHDITIISNTEYSRGFYDGLTIRENDILQGLSELKPSADVAPVVRCRDCAGCEYDTALDQYWCTRGRLIIGRHVMPDDFCSYGEKREE